VADIDGDGHIDVLVGGSWLRWRLWAFAPRVPFDPGAVAWGRARHDPHNTAYHPARFGLTASQPADGEVRLDWAVPADIFTPAAYEVYRGHERAGRVEEPGLDDAPEYGGTYTYVVVALDESGGIRARSVPVEIEVEGEEPPPDGGPPDGGPADGGGDDADVDVEGGCGCGRGKTTSRGWWLAPILGWISFRFRSRGGVT
jgi:hypothetical protein